MRERTPPVREIAWRDVCPWLLLFDAAAAAFEVRKTLIATAGLALTLVGWWIFAQALSEVGTAPTWGELVAGQTPVAAAATTGERLAIASNGPLWMNPLVESWHRLTGPFQRLVVGQPSWRQFAYAGLCAVWGLLIWAYFGATLGRMSAMQLGREEPASVRDGLTHARRKYWDYATAPLIPLGGALLLLLGVAAGGWLLRFDLGAVVAGVLAGPALLLGWFAALLIVAVFLAWPVMWGAISVDRCDNFGSFSSTYSFITQRPVHSAIYAALAAAIGAFLTLVVAQLAAVAVSLTFWAAGWTGGTETVAELRAALPPSVQAMTTALDATFGSANPSSAAASSPSDAAVTLIAFWCQLFALAIAGFGLNYLFTTATAIYLILRYDVDRTEFDAVDVDKPAKPERVPTAPSAPAGLPIVTLEAKRP